jgi:hypothetical protein
MNLSNLKVFYLRESFLVFWEIFFLFGDDFPFFGKFFCGKFFYFFGKIFPFFGKPFFGKIFYFFGKIFNICQH